MPGYKFSTYTFPDATALYEGTPKTIPCLPLTEHFIATPPLWVGHDDMAGRLLRSFPRITHKPTGRLVTPRSVGTLRAARYIARVLEALPQNWDAPRWDNFPEWARRYMLQWR